MNIFRFAHTVEYSVVIKKMSQLYIDDKEKALTSNVK